MRRKVVLASRAALWEEGDAARSIGMVESGKLGVMTDKGLIGILWPGMVVGESAIYTLNGQKQKRTASVFALEDNTTVNEYSVFLIKQVLDDGRDALGQQILTTLIGQIYRNFYLVVQANREKPLVTAPITGLVHELVRIYKQHAQATTRWDDFFFAFQYLYDLREYSAVAREQLVKFADDALIHKASDTVREVFHPDEYLPIVEDYLNAEKEKLYWLERFSPPGSRQSDPVKPQPAEEFTP